MGNVSTVVISTVETLPRISDSDVYVMLALHRRFRQVIVTLPAQRAGLLRAGGPRRLPPAPRPPALHRKKACLLGDSPPNPLKQIQL
jgi:hypothetical protein